MSPELKEAYHIVCFPFFIVESSRHSVLSLLILAQMIRSLSFIIIYIFYFFIFYFFKIYLFIQRERERGRDTGRGRSGLHAGSPTWARPQSQVSRIPPQAAGNTKPLRHWGCPGHFIFKVNRAMSQGK